MTGYIALRWNRSCNMVKNRTLIVTLCLVTLLLAALASACGASESSDQEWARQDGEITAAFGMPGPPGAPGPQSLPGSDVERVVREVVKEVQVAGQSVPAPSSGTARGTRSRPRGYGAKGRV